MPMKFNPTTGAFDMIGSSGGAPSVRIITGTATLLTTDQKVILKDDTGTAFNLNLPAGTDGLTFSIGISFAPDAGTLWTLVPHGADTLDGNINPSSFNTGNGPGLASVSITFKSGVWYTV